jgi:hypothetical protein
MNEYSGSGSAGGDSGWLTRKDSLDAERATPPSSDNEENERDMDLTNDITVQYEQDDDAWLELARSSYLASTSYVDTNYRGQWEAGINMFNGVHPAGSKYNDPKYEKRSRIFRPKIRSVIRKNEAAGAAAFFSNADIISTEAANASDPQQVASAAMMKELLQFRLKKSIKWYQNVMGALQDAQVTGACCAHVYWATESKVTEREVTMTELGRTPGSTTTPDLKIQKTVPENSLRGFQGEKEQAPEMGTDFDIINAGEIPGKVKSLRVETVKQREIVRDEPCVDLIPIDYIRIHPGSSWIDPVNSSPYIIELLPMFVVDVKRKMANGEWRDYDESLIHAAMDGKYSSTVLARLKNKQNPYTSQSGPITDYGVVWVQRHIHRKEDEDYEFYTLGDKALLTTPRPLKDTVFHGKRPYVIGNFVLETHKVYPSSIPDIAHGLQEEANEIANQRLDNIKFVLNKRYIVRRNKQVDINALVRNVPGGVVMADDPEKDIIPMSYPDVTQSSYAEQDRINGDMDELLGNFSAGSIATNRQLAETAKGMSLLSQQTNIMVEYGLRTFTETFVEPVLRLLILLEQHYETDENVLALCGQKAELMQRFGIDQDLDSLLQHEVTLNVNVGMGATSPDQKVNKLAQGLGVLKSIAGAAFESAVNFEEVTKEIFGALGYSDGSRFIKQGANPELEQAKKQIQALQMQLNSKQADNETKLGIARENNQTKMAIAGVKETNHNQRFLVDHFARVSTSQLQSLATDQSMKPTTVKNIAGPQANSQAISAPQQKPPTPMGQ